MLELSNFLLPSRWASMPLGGFVPDGRTESEVVLATKCTLETEKRFRCKTSKSSAWLSHLLGECLQGPQLEEFISPPHALCMQGRPQLENASHHQPRKTHSQGPTYSQNLR